MPRSYSHLNSQERALIETQLTFGMRPEAIAAGLMRAKSTVIRELRRNGWQSPTGLARRGRVRIAGGYRCVPADRRARLLAGTPCSAQAHPRQPAMAHRGRSSSPGLESGPDCEHTGSYARSRAALLRDHLHRALHHATGASTLQPARPDAPPTPRQKAATTQGRAQQAIHSRDDFNRLTACRDTDAPHPGPLGGRSDYWQGQPLSGRHAGRTHHPVCCPGEVEQQQGRRRGPGLHRDTQPLR